MTNNNIEKEQWIDDTLGSTAGMWRVTPPGGVYQRVLAATVAGRRQAPSLQLTRYWVAAAAAILLLVNVTTVVHATRGTGNNAAANGAMSTELQFSATYNY